MMARRAVLVFVVLAAVAVAEKVGDEERVKSEKKTKTKTAGGARKPVLTTDIIFSTFELLSDISDDVYNTFVGHHVSKHGPVVQAHVDKALDFVSAKAQMKKEDILGQVDLLKTRVGDTKATLAVHKATVHETLNGHSSKFVDAFDKALPRFAGLLPRTVGDLLLSVLYFAFIFYFLLRVVTGVFRLVLKTFCFFCCCGFCRRGKSSDDKPAKKAKGPATTAKGAKPAKK